MVAQGEHATIQVDTRIGIQTFEGTILAVRESDGAVVVQIAESDFLCAGPDGRVKTLQERHGIRNSPGEVPCAMEILSFGRDRGELAGIETHAREDA